MNFKVALDFEIISVSLIRKKNIKHCYLRIVENKTVQISANSYFTKDEAIDLVKRKQKWIKKHLEKKELSLDTKEYLYLGKVYEKEELDFDIIEFYKKEAKAFLPQLVEKNAKLMELYPSSLKFRNNKSRWGSCSYKNGIILNIKLMKFPIEVIEYVVIHELAHIKHKNHSKRFWSLVEKYCPNYKECERLMKTF